MERIVDNIFVPCKHGCSTTIAYYQKEKHERQCPCGPCLCPVSGCGFVAPTTVLLDHLATVHKLPTTPMELFKPFEVPVLPGSRVLKTKFNRLFLLKMEALDGVAVGEVVEAEVDVEVEHLRCYRLLPLHQVVMSETRRWSLSCSYTNRRVAIFAFPSRSQGCWRLTSRRV